MALLNNQLIATNLQQAAKPQTQPRQSYNQTPLHERRDIRDWSQPVVVRDFGTLGDRHGGGNDSGRIGAAGTGGVGDARRRKGSGRARRRLLMEGRRGLDDDAREVARSNQSGKERSIGWEDGLFSVPRGREAVARDPVRGLDANATVVIAKRPEEVACVSERSQKGHPWASHLPTKFHLTSLHKQMEVFTIKNHQGALAFRVNRAAIPDPSNFNDYYKHRPLSASDRDNMASSSMKQSVLSPTVELPEPKNLDHTDYSLSGHHGKSIPSFKSSRLIEPEDIIQEGSEKSSAHNRSKQNTKRTKESMVKSKQHSSKESEQKAYLRALEKLSRDKEKKEFHRMKLEAANSPRERSQGSQVESPIHDSRFTQIKPELASQDESKGTELKKTPSMQDLHKLEEEKDEIPFDSLVNKQPKGLGLHISSEFAIPTKGLTLFTRGGSIGGSSSPKSHRESMHLDSELASPTSVVQHKNHDLSTEFRECRIPRHTFRGGPKPVYVDKSCPFGNLSALIQVI